MTPIGNPRVTPWQIDDSEFYEIDDPKAQKEFMLRYAVLAPSGHNAQPWSFSITDDTIEVHPDYSRRLPIADPMDRELMLSVGAAVTNLRVAAAHFGFESTVMYQLPDDPANPVAVVTLRETCDPDEELRGLFGSITRRHTARAEFENRPIEPETLDRLCAFVEGSEMTRFVLQHERARAAALVEEADRLLMSDESWRSEMAAWVRSNEGGATDGISADAFGIPGPLSVFAPMIMRKLDLGGPQAKRDRELLEHAPGLIVVTSDDDNIALLRAGEALERLLLVLTSIGVQYGFMNQVIQVPELRRELWKLTRTPRPPQLLIRIGYARARSRAMPRRPVDAVVT